MSKELKSNSHTEMNRLRNKFGMTKNNSHAEFISASTGRSMVEMLGTLAIIGILSIGAVFGLRMAFDSYNANNLLDDVRLYAATILHNEYNIDVATNEFNPSTEYAYGADWVEEQNLVYGIEVVEVPKGVCKSAKNKAKDAYLIEVNGVAEGACSEEQNTMHFIFNADDICSENCANICCDGVCCPSNEYTCVEGKCHREADCNDNENICGNDCCEKGNSCCSGTCCQGSMNCTGLDKNECCPFYRTTGDGKLCCSEEQLPCDDECCPQGSVCTNGVCRTAECYEPGSTTEKCTGSNCDCYIGSERCGTGCSADGLSCSYGLCKDFCLSSDLFVYDETLRFYGCNTDVSLGRVFCTTSNSITRCYFNGESCGYVCNLNATECTYGACDQSNCSPGYSVVKSPYEMGVFASSYVCSDGIHYCAGTNCALETGGICATGCNGNDFSKCAGSDHATAGNHCDGCGWGTLEPGTQTCCEGDFCCKVAVGEGRKCAYKGQTCGYFCSEKDGYKNCQNGTCDASDCPAGTIWTQIAGYNFGCYNNETNVLCYNLRGGYRCLNNGTLNNGKYTDYQVCGTECTSYNADGCDSCITGDGVCADNWTFSAPYSCLSKTEPSLLCSMNTNETNCYRDGILCGQCSIDGTNCTLNNVKSYCSVVDCPAGQALQYNASKKLFECIDYDVPQCENGVCKINNINCGTGCQSDGTNCSTGTCVADECTDETTLIQVNNQYHGCYSATNGTKCYKYGNAYVCYKNGVECGTGCKIDGSDCLAGQTCVVEE